QSILFYAIWHYPCTHLILTLQLSTSKEEGIYHQIEHILDAAGQYFLAPEDLIPDHLGIQ
ncbi:MAG: hypothetical protein PVH27_13725, partial [Desulfobacterales bacterium]